jgi:hypothetical protein
MRPLMRFVVVVALLAVGCGKEIGDSCIVSSDCSPNGDRTCEDPDVFGGYCTIRGCDFDTCPEESTCVRFFTGHFENIECTKDTEDVDCSLDELCSLQNRCVPRSSEVRFCMKTCDSDSDCRDNYECRDLAKMRLHGGEPVLEGGAPVDSSSPKFCAVAP